MAEETNQVNFLEEAEANRAKAEAAKADAETEKIIAEIRVIKENSELQKQLTEVELEKRQEEVKALKSDIARKNDSAELEATRVEAEKTLAEAQLRRADAENTRTTDQSALSKQRKDFMDIAQQQVAAGNAGMGIRKFVRNTLLDIMGAVDDAAAVAKAVELNDGLVNFLPSVSAVGSTKSNEKTNQVEFDLVLSVIEEQATDGQMSGQLKIGVQSLFGAAVSLSTGSSQSAAREQTNRIRFSVPVTYAAQNIPGEDE